MAQILPEDASTPDTLQQPSGQNLPKLSIPHVLGPASQSSGKSSMEDERGMAWRSRSNALDVSKLSPRRAKRIMANRQAAHRSRMKKMKYTSNMEQIVAQLQEENRAVAERITGTQHYSAALQEDNKNLRNQLESLQKEEREISQANSALLFEINSRRTMQPQQPLFWS